ncbi:iron-containing redox enzyme family protein [Arthrobacter gandavensis]|uniref:iron-containing redox enzyme family protein n=1 Tax=Arthrobacter gandavensis TaxID=169960 RepID=UPI00188F6DA1|nr:iron-containing redox enzyme family protein [Arthrobacter gandavensis]MBF4994695.1 iron-containing redox enzyme family protein [Arthrobacter gandavensis]
MLVPAPRGELTSALLSVLQDGPQATAEQYGKLDGAAERALAGSTDILRADDLQLALFLLYELHYSGLDGVDADMEWQPELIRVRRKLEAAFEAALRQAVPVPEAPSPAAEEVAQTLFKLAAGDDGPSVARFVARHATEDQLREFLVLRSVYQLREADPHSWAIPRLPVGRAKAALVEIQADEYGGGRPERMHSALFARTMEGLGLDTAYGRYLDRIPALVLASSNAMSLFGLNRRLRGCIAGHLAAFEMTSSIPNSFYTRGFKRAGYGPEVTFYFDEHVEADAVHEQIAARDLAGGLAEAEPHLLKDILFGAATVLTLDALQGAEQLEAWKEGRSALREDVLSRVGAQALDAAAAGAGGMA